MTNKKYELLKDRRVVIDGKSLYRIKSLISFGQVKKGQIGGFIESEYNLSHEGLSFVFDDSVVSEGARIYDDARVMGSSSVTGNAEVYGNSTLTGYVDVRENAKIYGHAHLDGDIIVKGEARIFDFANIKGMANISENSMIFGDAYIRNDKENRFISKKDIRVSGTSRLEGNIHLHSDTEIMDNVHIDGDFVMFGRNRLSGNALLTGSAFMFNNNYIKDNAKLVAEALFVDNIVLKDNADISKISGVLKNGVLDKKFDNNCPNHFKMRTGLNLIDGFTKGYLETNKELKVGKVYDNDRYFVNGELNENSEFDKIYIVEVPVENIIGFHLNSVTSDKVKILKKVDKDDSQIQNFLDKIFQV